MEAATAATSHDGAKPPENAIDRLKEKRRMARSERDPLDLPIPGYGGELIARYRALGYDEVQKINKAVVEMVGAGDDHAGLKGNIDTIGEACIGIFLSDGEGNLTALNETVPEFGEEPVCYDSRLATALDIAADRRRALIRQVFPNDLAIDRHAGQVARWISDTDEAADQDF